MKEIYWFNPYKDNFGPEKMVVSDKKTKWGNYIGENGVVIPAEDAHPTWEACVEDYREITRKKLEEYQQELEMIDALILHAKQTKN